MRAVTGVNLSIAPNPVRDRTTVVLDLEAESHVRVAVYDVLGREVLVIANGARAAGRHPLTMDVARLMPGAYVVRVQIQAGNEVTARRVTVAR